MEKTVRCFLFNQKQTTSPRPKSPDSLSLQNTEVAVYRCVIEPLWCFNPDKCVRIQITPIWARQWQKGALLVDVPIHVQHVPLRGIYLEIAFEQKMFFV